MANTQNVTIVHPKTYMMVGGILQRMAVGATTDIAKQDNDKKKGLVFKNGMKPGMGIKAILTSAAKAVKTGSEEKSSN